MSDGITFLGTGGGRISVANQFCSTGGFILQLANNQIHVDPGPGALASTRRFCINPTKTDIIFCSHEHIDHANDLNAVIYATTIGGINKRGILVSTKKVVESWLLPEYKENLKEVITIASGDTVQLDNVRFISTETNHDVEAVGFKLVSQDLCIGYTSDTAYTKRIGAQFKDCDVLIANILRPGNDRWKTHMCTDDAAKLASQVRPELFVIQHFGAKMLKVKPLYEAREVQRASGVRTMAATDGMQIGLSGVRRRDSSEP